MSDATVVVTEESRVPAWATALAARCVPVHRLPTALREAPADAVLVDGEALQDPIGVARRVHATDHEVQVVLVVPDDRRRLVERALLFAPGVGEVWLASAADASGAIAERASGVTRQRRQFARTRERIEAAARTESPQQATRALVSDALLAGLLQVMPDAVFTVDSGGRVLSANAAAERLAGLAGTALVGQRIDEVVRLTGPVAPLLGEETITRDIGFGDAGDRAHGRIGELTIVPLRVGTAELWAVLLHDVTEREMARQQLAMQAEELEATAEELMEQASELEHQRELADEARARAEQANAAKSQFLAMMSHELRQPLNAIAGYTDLMLLQLRGPLTDQQREDLERIRRTGTHLLTLINDILLFARMEAGRLELRAEPTPLDETIEEIVHLVEPQVVAKGLSYRYEPAGADVRVLADAERLRQIVLNLVSNAVKFTPAGGTIVVRGAADATMASVVVEDTGIGIEEDKLDQIFDPFMQVHRRLSSPQEGVGLGLAISRDLARAMQGDITVRSRPGEGAIFTVTLPRA